MKQKKVPTAGKHILYALVLTLLVCGFLFVINPESAFDPATRRAITRCGAAFLVVGAVLGYFGINWSKDNKRQLRDAQREIVTCTEVTLRLKDDKRTQVIAAELSRLDDRKIAAERDLAEATNFEETVAKVSFGALAFLVVGTILQAIATNG